VVDKEWKRQGFVFLTDATVACLDTGDWVTGIINPVSLIPGSSLLEQVEEEDPKGNLLTWFTWKNAVEQQYLYRSYTIAFNRCYGMNSIILQ